MYKLVWLDLALFLFIYYSLSSIYRLILDEEQKKIFAAIVAYCNAYSDLIPLSFVLGFYVSIVMTRWWNQYMVIPWPDSIAVFVSATIHGNDERGRLMRRTIVRYIKYCATVFSQYDMKQTRNDLESVIRREKVENRNNLYGILKAKCQIL